MIISNVDADTIDAAARAAGIWAERRAVPTAYGHSTGLRWRVKCRPIPESGRFYRRGQSRCQRVSGALCWHGFKAFFDALFNRAPDARVYTAYAKYRGQREYEARYEQSGLIGLGGRWRSLYAQDACDCAILAQSLECQCCGTREGVTYKRHGWDSMTVVCGARVCRRAVKAVRMLRGEE